jgi:hypothetical protein
MRPHYFLTLSLRNRAYRRALLVASALALVAWTGKRADAQAAGTYRLSICTSPCAPTDSGVVRGYLVLFGDSHRLDSLPTPLRDSLVRRSFWLLRRSTVTNTCFALPTGPTHVNGQELYAGIIRRGLTQWRREGATVRVRLYQSPDASYTLVGAMTTEGYVGRGEQHNCCGGESPITYFLATRVKEADPSACL